MVPHAILLDLDETLIDRTQSIMQYAECFRRGFADCLAPMALPTIAATILSADERGYRPREALLQDLLQQFPWRTTPDVERLCTHWETWFPASSVARVGLQETLSALHMQGIRLGIITNGVVRRQQPKIEQLQIRPYLSTVVISEAVHVKKPDPRIFTRALAEVGCQASRAWFVGDHPVNDVGGAASAGLRPIWLTGIHPWPSDKPEPEWQIDSLVELASMVQQERNFAT